MSHKRFIRALSNGIFIPSVNPVPKQSVFSHNFLVYTSRFRGLHCFVREHQRAQSIVENVFGVHVSVVCLYTILSLGFLGTPSPMANICIPRYVYIFRCSIVSLPLAARIFD